MKNKKQYNVNEKLEAEVIASAYGDNSFIKKISILMLCKIRPELNDLYYSYKNTSILVKQISKEKCPKYISAFAINQVSKEKREKSSGYAGIITLLVRQPVVSVAVLFLCVTILIFSLVNKSQPPEFSQAQIEMASIQAKQAFVIVGNIFNRTSNKVTKDILPNQVGVPVNQGLTIIDNIFKENKNEMVN